MKRLESCSRLNPDDVHTHIVTARTLSFAGAVIPESEQHWRDDQGRLRRVIGLWPYTRTCR